MAGVALLVVFGFHQRRAAAPLVEPSLFVHRGFPAALAGSLLYFAVMTGLMLLVPMRLQLGEGVDVRTASLTLLPLSAGLAVSSWVAGAWLVPKFGSRVMFAGLGLLLAGILAVAAGVTPALALCGLGMGTRCRSSPPPCTASSRTRRARPPGCSTPCSSSAAPSASPCSAGSTCAAGRRPRPSASPPD